LASIGQLAAGVAHQINNPLGAISGRAQLLARSREPVDAGFLRTQIDKIQADCGRIAETVNDLLGFARKTESAKQHTDVNAVLDEAIDMVSHEAIARKVTVERRLPADLPLVLGSAHHLRQLFANLMTNAFDAMGPGGTLTITTTPRPPDDGQPQPMVEIAVADTGSGISPEELEHIFEPFYTTKPPGEGTGLGLAVAKRIIEFHDGRIDVKSEPGVGTTFTIQLVVAR
ncbi:sensor histidine kinase, partial [bacterium]|nr:sensor histidine kinase [bacterium]